MTWNPKSMSLWQELALALAVKIALLIVIWAAFFSAPLAPGGLQAASHIFPEHSPKEQNHDADHRTR